MIKNMTDDIALQNSLPVVFNITLFICCLIMGYFIDKYSSCRNMLKKTYLFMLIFSVPIYALQDTVKFG